MDPRERFRPPSRRAVLRASWLWAPVTLVTFAAKVHKFAKLRGDAPWTDLAPILAADVLWLGVMWGLSMVVFDRERRWLRALGTGLMHGVAAVWGLLAGMEHAYFTATGAVPDGYMIKEVLTRWDDVRTAIGSELSAPRIALMSAPVVYALFVVPLAFWLAKVGDHWPARRRADWKTSPARRWVAPASVAGTLALPALLFSPADALTVLQRNAVVSASRELLDAFSDEDALWANFAVKPLPPLTLTRKAAKAKNLIVLTLESVSAKATSLDPASDYRPAAPTTPFLQALAARGARVERAYTVMPHTSKALVSIHCGVYPKFVPPVVESEPGGIPSPCLARLLREQGFATAFFQPAEENYEARSNLVREFGFETFIGKESLDGRGFDEASYFGWEDDVMVEPIAKWAAAQKQRGKPFFAGVLTLTSHHPYAIPRGYETRRLVSDGILNDYLNSVAYTDRFVEKLFAALAREGLLEDTLVVVSGDHGEAFGEHGRYQHDTAVYEENARVPMVLVGPGVPAGKDIGGLRQIIDVMPTALDVLGFEPSRALLGKNLLGEAGHPSVYLHCYFQKRCRAFVDGSVKTIDNYRTRGLEVYDLAADPGERTNLFGENASADHRARERSAAMDNLAGETNALYVAQARTRREAFVRRSMPSVGEPVAVDYGSVEIVRALVSPKEIEVGGRTDVTLVYHVKETPKAGLRTFMHIVSGKQWTNADHDPVGGAYPVSEWKAGDYVVDTFTVTTRPEHPLGKYDVRVGFWTKKDGNLAPIKTDRDKDGRERVTVGSFRVVGEHVNLAEHVLREAPPLPNPVDVAWRDAAGRELVRLRSVTLDKPAIKGGLKVTFGYVFEVMAALPPKSAFAVRVEGPSPFEAPHAPLGGKYPPSEWKPGEFIVDPHGIITKTRDRAGTYRVFLSLRVDGRELPASGEGLPLDADGAVLVGSYTLVAGSERR